MTEILWTAELEVAVAAVEATFVPRDAETDFAELPHAPESACKIWCSGGNIFLEFEDENGKARTIHIPRNRSGVEALLLTILKRETHAPRRVTQSSSHALFSAIDQFRGDVKKAKPLRIGKRPSISLADLGLMEGSSIDDDFKKEFG